MSSQINEAITVQAVVNANVEKVWKFYTEPEHIMKWNNASGDWHTPRAENDLRVGGRFLFRMEAKDGSAGFDFEGTYEKVNENELISYVMDDGRKVEIVFAKDGQKTRASMAFDTENTNPIEMQRSGRQAPGVERGGLPPRV